MPKSISSDKLLPSSALLKLKSVEQSESGWTVTADGPDQAACPQCGYKSVSRHSRYVRTLKDLPAVGGVVSLRICVGRWRCRNPGCAVRFFTGLLPGVAQVRGRRTCRAEVITQLLDTRWEAGQANVSWADSVCRSVTTPFCDG